SVANGYVKVIRRPATTHSLFARRPPQNQPLIFETEPDAKLVARAHGVTIFCRGSIVSGTGFRELQRTRVEARAARGLGERRGRSQPARVIHTSPHCGRTARSE